MSRFSPPGPGIGQAIGFDDRDRLARVLIRPIPAPNSCVLGVGPRNQCAIRHMPMPSLRLEAGFLAGESGSSLTISLFTCVDSLRDPQRITQSGVEERNGPTRGPGPGPPGRCWMAERPARPRGLPVLHACSTAAETGRVPPTVLGGPRFVPVPLGSFLRTHDRASNGRARERRAGCGGHRPGGDEGRDALATVLPSVAPHRPVE